MKRKRFLTTLTALIIATTVTITQPVFAMNLELPPTDVSDYYVHISHLAVDLSIDNTGRANCIADVSGFSSSSALKVYMYLERKQGTTWTPYQSWSATKTGLSLSMTKSLTVPSGTYRVKASVYANGENVVAYSGVDGY